MTRAVTPDCTTEPRYVPEACALFNTTAVTKFTGMVSTGAHRLNFAADTAEVRFRGNSGVTTWGGNGGG
jgi:hypothetical protein